MTSKPTTWTGYSAEDLDLVTRTCLYVFTKLGDLLEKVVVVGGLVPYLLVNQEDLPMGMERHSGTTDLDLGLALTILDDQLYQDVSDRLNEAGFSPDVNPKGKSFRPTVGNSLPSNGDRGFPDLAARRS